MPATAQLAKSAPLDLIALAQKPGAEPLRRYLEAVDEARQGRPRKFIEGYLWVKALNEQLVPVRFKEEQDYYYAETFGRAGFEWDTAMVIEVLKHREAFSTLFWCMCGYAFFCTCPGFVMSLFIDVESKLGKTIIPIFDNFRNNMVPIEIDVEGKHYVINIKPDLAHSDMQFWEIEHESADDGQKLSSFINFIPAGSSQALRGGRSKMTLYSERDYYALEHDAKLGVAGIGGKPPGAWEINESTPQRSTGNFYALYKALRNDEVPGGILLVRLWPQKKSNSLRVGGQGWLKRDAEELRATGTLKLTAEEVLVTSLFPNDGVPVVERIGWRRAKIQEYVTASFGSEPRGKAAFLQEYPEDTESCWTSLAEGHLPEERLKILRLEAGNHPPVKAPWMPFPGMRATVWEIGRSDPYLAFLDPALGGGDGDDLAMIVLNRRTGMQAARVYGKAFVDHFVTQCVMLLRDPQYFGALGEPLLGIEVNGNGQRALKQAQDLGYRNLYRRPVSGRPVPGTMAALRQGDLGLDASRLVTSMHNAMYASLYGGDVTSFDQDLLGSLMRYDPNDEKQHCPDDVAAFRGAAYLLDQLGGRVAAPVRGQQAQQGQRVIIPVGYV